MYALLDIIIFLFFLAIYLIPAIVAHVRHVRDFGSVLVLNIFLGWTIIGWAVALAMASRTVDARREA